MIEDTLAYGERPIVGRENVKLAEKRQAAAVAKMISDRKRPRQGKIQPEIRRERGAEE